MPKELVKLNPCSLTDPPCDSEQRSRQPSHSLFLSLPRCKSAWWLGCVLEMRLQVKALHHCSNAVSAVFTLNRYFYPMKSVYQVSVLIHHPKEIQILCSETETKPTRRPLSFKEKKVKCFCTGWENTLKIEECVAVWYLSGRREKHWNHWRGWFQ